MREASKPMIQQAPIKFDLISTPSNQVSQKLNWTDWTYRSWCPTLLEIRLPGTINLVPIKVQANFHEIDMSIDNNNEGDEEQSLFQSNFLFYNINSHETNIKDKLDSLHDNAQSPVVPSVPIASRFTVGHHRQCFRHPTISRLAPFVGKPKNKQISFLS